MYVFRGSWWNARFTAGIEDSRSVRVFASSLVCRMLVRTVRLTVRSLEGQSSFVARLFAGQDPPSDFRLVADLVTGSQLYRIVCGAVATVGPATWRSSLVCRSYAHYISGVDRHTRVRLVAWAVLAAALVRAVFNFQTIASSPVAFSAWLLVVIVAGLAFAGAPTFEVWRRRPPHS